MAKKTILPLIALCALMGGCEQMGYLLYLIAPGELTKEKEAEYKELPNHSVAVVIFADQATQYEYPYVRLEIGAVVGEDLRRQLKGVTVMDTRRVTRYQDENIHWADMDKTALAKAFGVDYLLCISLVEYSTREPGSVNLYRGQIHAEAGLYRADKPEKDARVWNSQFRVIYPTDTGMGVPDESDEKVRYETERIFAELLVKSFYKHKGPKSK